MALTPQKPQNKKPAMQFGEHRQIDQVLSEPKKEKRVQVVLDENLHTEFKMACLKNSTNISAVVTELIQDWLKNNK